MAPASPYQTRRWLTRWLDTKAAGLAIDPMIVVARDADGLPLALLPFGIRRTGRLTVAGFLGGRDSNFNLGLFRPGVSWDRNAVMDLLRRAAAQSGTSIDLFSLRNQPVLWEGTRNPLALLDGQPSPSFAHRVALMPDPRAFLQTLLSKDTRKKLRRKSERLAGIGPVEHRVATTPADRAACLDAFMDQRTARNLALGLSTSDLPDQRRFLEHASDPAAGPPPVEAHGLYCGERIVATFFGTLHRHRFCGMAMSFDADPVLSRSSPGELMLVSLLESKCRQGLALFDLGIGEARYKTTYCPRPRTAGRRAGPGLGPRSDLCRGGTPAALRQTAHQAIGLGVGDGAMVAPRALGPVRLAADPPQAWAAEVTRRTALQAALRARDPAISIEASAT